ncbi:MAG: tRNA pseudouridine(55) synthase TruB [Sphingopyxis sp.]
MGGTARVNAPPTPRNGPALNGWIIIDKPLTLGSTQGVSAVKRALRAGGYGKVKVGHGGTLDPLATGVLPIALGEGTKLAGRMLDASKSYDFTIEFGSQTDTLDREGVAVAHSAHRPTGADIAAILPAFTGAIEQAPPAYSAILIDGQRAYDLARSGVAVEMKRRAVTIHALCVVPDDAGADAAAPVQQVTLRAHVSKGTYIRSLARDIALALGTVGHVAMLRRTRAGPFGLAQAISLDKLSDAAMARNLEEVLLPLEAGLDGIPALSLSPDEAKLIRQGRTLFGQSVIDGLYLAMDGQTPVALVMVSAGQLAVERGFNL